MAFAPLPVIAQPVAANFAPPLDRDIRYETIEQRNHPGLTLRFKLNQRVRFVRDESGYRMTVTLYSATSDAPPAMAQRFEAAFRPFVGLHTTLLLSRDGKPLGLADERATWEQMRTSLATLRGDARLAADVVTTIETILAGIAALPAEARRAKLMENPLRLVGYALPPLEKGEKIENGDIATRVIATLQTINPNSLTYNIRTRKALSRTDTLHGASEMVIDRRTGLLHQGVTREWIGQDGDSERDPPDTEITVRRVD